MGGHRIPLHASGVEYEIAIGMRVGRGEAVVAGLGRTEREFSERDRDVLDVARPGLEGQHHRRAGPRIVGERANEAGRCVPRGPTGSTATGRSSSAPRTQGSGWPSTTARPSTPDGCRARSRTGSRCRRARRWSASATAGV